MVKVIWTWSGMVGDDWLIKMVVKILWRHPVRKVERKILWEAWISMLTLISKYQM